MASREKACMLISVSVVRQLRLRLILHPVINFSPAAKDMPPVRAGGTGKAK